MMIRISIPSAALKVALIGLVLSSSTGCLMCCAPNYDMYPAYGGAWERTDRAQGRVGSIFHPAGDRVVGTSAQEPSDALETIEPPAPRVPDVPESEEDILPPFPDDLKPADPAAPLDPMLQTNASTIEVEPPPFREGPRLQPARPPEPLSNENPHRLSGLYEPLR